MRFHIENIVTMTDIVAITSKNVFKNSAEKNRKGLKSAVKHGKIKDMAMLK